MKRLFYLVVVVIMASCVTTVPSSVAKSLELSEGDYSDFIPNDPPYPSKKVQVIEDNEEIEKYWASLSNNEVSKNLPLQDSKMTYQKIDGSGTLKYLSAGATTSIGNYIITLDYTKYCADVIIDESTNKEIGIGKIGVGLRIKVELATTETNIDLGSMLAIGIAAKLGYVKGTITVMAIGIDSPEITNLFPSPSSIDETSIQKSLEAIAAIKSKLSDENTTLSPHIIAVKVLQKNRTTEEIKALINT